MAFTVFSLSANRQLASRIVHRKAGLPDTAYSLGAAKRGVDGSIWFSSIKSLYEELFSACS